MNQLPRHAELALAMRNIALAPDKLRALQAEGLRLNPLVAAGKIIMADAMEALCDTAQGHGLCLTPDARQVVEHVVRGALAGRETLSKEIIGTGAKAASVKGFDRAGMRAPAPAVVTLRCMSEISPEPVHWLWLGRLAAGKVGILFGEPGIGKSQISLDIAARVSTGGAWPDGGSAPLGDVVILSSEDGLADTVRPRLDAAGADVNRIHVVEAVKNPKGGTRTFNIGADLDALETAIGAIEGNVRLVIIDPITSYMGSIDSHLTTDVRGVLEPLAAFAEKLGLAVLAISHPPKSTPAKAMNAVTGSGAYVAFARSVFLVAEEPETDRRLLLPVKSSLTEHPDGLAFRLEQAVINGTTNIEASRVVWSSDPVTITADEALAAASTASTPNNAVTQAEAVLSEILSSGPLQASEVKERAKAQGISERTLARAKKNLGVVAQKDGRLDGPWIWNAAETIPKAANNHEGCQTK